MPDRSVHSPGKKPDLSFFAGWQGGNFREKNDLRLDFPEKEITLSS